MTSNRGDAEGVSILHVSQPTDGGVARVVAQLAADQIGRGWRVSVASPAGRLADDVAAAGATWLPWTARRSPGPTTFAETVRLRRIIGSVRPNAVHLHSSKAGLAGRLVVRGRVPTLFEPHAWSFHAVRGTLLRMTVAWERWAGRWTTAIVCVSAAEREEGEQEGIRAASWHVVPNGVDTAQVHEADASERAAARAELGIPGDVSFAVCVGRLSVQKGQDVLLRAWPAVRAGFPSARLALVGDGPLRAQLARDLPPGVGLVGHREDVPAWLGAADVVVMPSRWEGMSLALLEAMARGRSVVAADVAGVRDALGAASSAIVPVDGPAELAAAICERFADPALASSEGRANRATVERRFSLERTLDAMADLTERLVSAPPDEPRPR
jgi:glycosyltransferase involved in cell wall biosynthesis